LKKTSTLWEREKRANFLRFHVFVLLNFRGGERKKGKAEEQGGEGLCFHGIQLNFDLWKGGRRGTQGKEGKEERKKEPRSCQSPREKQKTKNTREKKKEREEKAMRRRHLSSNYKTSPRGGGKNGRKTNLRGQERKKKKKTRT